VAEDKNNGYIDVWERFINGNDDAISFLYFEFFDEMLNFGLKYTQDIGVVEDCIQDFFVELFNKRESLPKVNNIKFYFFSSIKHKLLRQLKRKNFFQQDDRIAESNFFIDYSFEAELITEETKKQYSKLLEKCIGQLSPNQKEAIYLRFNCGMDYNEISSILEINVASSRTLIYRSVKAIKDMIEKSGFKGLVLLSILPFPQKKTIPPVYNLSIDVT
jgi:RNA polymerase sigma factor (sigma-70 family)